MSLGTDVEEDVGVTELFLSIPRDWMLCRLITVDVVEDDVINMITLPFSSLSEKTRTTTRVATKVCPLPPPK